jgi:hypothetical protein
VKVLAGIGFSLFVAFGITVLIFVSLVGGIMLLMMLVGSAGTVTPLHIGYIYVDICREGGRGGRESIRESKSVPSVALAAQQMAWC